MKKLFAFLMALTLCLGAAGCAEKNPEATEIPVISTAGASVEKTVPAPEGPVEITMDNWQTYFELRPAAEPYLDETGNILSWDFGYGVFLKEEYLDRFQSGEVNFEVTYEEEQRTFTEREGGYELGDPVPYTAEPRAKTFALQDFRGEAVSELSDYFGAVAGALYCGASSTLEDGTAVALVPAKGEVLHAEGTLVLQ